MQHRQLALQEEDAVAQDVLVARSEVVAVLENAAGLDVGKGEGLGHNPDAAGLDQQLVVDRAAERHDGAVGLGHPRVDAVHAGDLRDVRDLHVGVLLPLLGQDLEPEVLGDVAVGVVVALDPVEHHGRGAGGDGHALHGQFFRCGLLEIEGGEG